VGKGLFPPPEKATCSIRKKLCTITSGSVGMVSVLKTRGDGNPNKGRSNKSSPSQGGGERMAPGDKRLKGEKNGKKDRSPRRKAG